MLIIRKDRFDAIIPAVPCNRAMRDAIEQAASNEGVPMPVIVHSAIRFFLDSNSSKTGIDSSLTDESGCAVRQAEVSK